MHMSDQLWGSIVGKQFHCFKYPINIAFNSLVNCAATERTCGAESCQIAVGVLLTFCSLKIFLFYKDIYTFLKHKYFNS